MTYIYATWLREALEADKFVADRLIVLNDWQTRGRPPSTGSFFPSGTLDHHTACMIRTGHDPQLCLNGILRGNSVAPGPISQLFGTWTPLGVRWNGSNPDPRIILVAAGRCNHAGVTQYPWGAPGGNASSIGLEWCGPPADQSGTDRWPDIVVELRARTTAAIHRKAGWDPNRQATTHYEAARPLGRKIDQSGKWLGEPNLATYTTPWGATRWRQEVQRYMSVAPPPNPSPSKHTVRDLPGGMSWPIEHYPAWTGWLQWFFYEQGWWPREWINNYWTADWQSQVAMVQRAFERTSYPSSPDPLTYTNGWWMEETKTKILAWAKIQDWY